MNFIIELRKELLNKYTELEEKYKPRGVDVGTYDTPVNFNESLTIPIQDCSLNQVVLLKMISVMCIKDCLSEEELKLCWYIYGT